MSYPAEEQVFIWANVRCTNGVTKCTNWKKAQLVLCRDKIQEIASMNYDKNKQDGACTTQMLSRKNIATEWIINENSNTVKAADRKSILICTQTRLYSN